MLMSPGSEDMVEGPIEYLPAAQPVQPSRPISGASLFSSGSVSQDRSHLAPAEVGCSAPYVGGSARPLSKQTTPNLAKLTRCLNHPVGDRCAVDWKYRLAASSSCEIQIPWCRRWQTSRLNHWR